MANISKIKLPNDATTHNIKDATARSNITKITNKTTVLAYGDELSISGSDLSLLDPNDNVLSTVTLPGGIAPPEVVLGAKRKLIWNGTESQWVLDMEIPFGYDAASDTASNASLWQQSYTMYTGNMQPGEIKHFSLILNCGDDFGAAWSFAIPFIKDVYSEGCLAKITKNAVYSAPQTGVTDLHDLDLEYLYDINAIRNKSIQSDAGTTTSNGAKIRAFAKLAIVHDMINNVFYRRVDYWLWNVSDIADTNSTTYTMNPSTLQWLINDESHVEWPSA